MSLSLRALVSQTAGCVCVLFPGLQTCKLETAMHVLMCLGTNQVSPGGIYSSLEPSLKSTKFCHQKEGGSWHGGWWQRHPPCGHQIRVPVVCGTCQQLRLFSVKFNLGSWVSREEGVKDMTLVNFMFYRPNNPKCTFLSENWEPAGHCMHWYAVQREKWSYREKEGEKIIYHFLKLNKLQSVHFIGLDWQAEKRKKK